MIQMELGLLADNAHVDQSGKLYILGEFKYITTERVPATHMRLSIVARLIAPSVEVRGKKSSAQIQFVNQDGQPILPPSPAFPLGWRVIGPGQPHKSMTQLICEIGGLPIPTYGDFCVSILVDGQHVGQIPFHVSPKPTALPPSPQA